MKELSERELETLNDGRVLRAESDVLIPLLSTKQALAVGKLIHAYREGQHEKLLSIAAEISTISEMQNTITQKIKVAEGLERKIYDGERGD